MDNPGELPRIYLVSKIICTQMKWGIFDLDIVQWSILVNNAPSPLPLLGNRGSGSPQSLRKLVCIIKCLVNLVEQLVFGGFR